MDKATILAIVLGVFASSGFWAFVTKLYEESKKKKQKSPIADIVLALGRERLLDLNNKYQKLGYIPESEFEMYDSMGKSYIAAGGNSRVKKGYESNMAKLPIKEEVVL